MFNILHRVLLSTDFSYINIVNFIYETLCA